MRVYVHLDEEEPDHSELSGLGACSKVDGANTYGVKVKVATFDLGLSHF